MTVSPANAGNVKVDGTVYTSSCGYSNGTVLTIEAVESDTYKFDHWGGSLSGSANPTILMINSDESVFAYFTIKFIPEPVGLQKAKEELLDENNDFLLIDVSSASDFAAGHILCARNYVWSSGSNTFLTSITDLNPYMEDDILVYDQDGSKSEAAAQYLSGLNFEKVSYMTDGLSDWEEAGLEDAGYETFVTGNYPGGDNNVCTSLTPFAYAGADKSVNENQTVTLKGSPGTGVTYEWFQAEGNNNLTLITPLSQNTTFTAPDLDDGDDALIFHLTVTDDVSGNTDTDSVKIDVKWLNADPTANAGDNKTVTEGEFVILNGSGTDSDGTIASYEWSQEGTPKVTLSNRSSAQPTFRAPDVSDSTVLTFTLLVTDNNDAIDTDTVIVTVNDEGTTPPPQNEVPTANAGADQALSEGQTVTLNGSGSSDSDGTIASYEWSQSGTPTVQLSNTSIVQPTFTAPEVSASTVLTFMLTVTDNEGATGTDDTVTVTVNDDGITPPAENIVPTANAGSDQSVEEAKVVSLDGSSSTDSDGTIAGYAWTQTDSTGITVALSSNSAAKPTFTAPDVDSATTLTFALIVTDNEGDGSLADTVGITITAASSGGGGGGCFINSLAD